MLLPFLLLLLLNLLQLIVKFKPGISKENRGKALGKAKAEEQKVIASGNAVGGAGGDVVLVKVKDNKAKRVGLKAAAADIKNGEYLVQARQLLQFQLGMIQPAGL
jgi:hypothetical protein